LGEEMAKARMLKEARKCHEKLQALYQPYMKFLIVRPACASPTPLTTDGQSENVIGLQEGAEERERHAMLTYVVKEMPTELYTELLEGVKMPGQVLERDDEPFIQS
jgi:hypothetical protein